MPTDSVDAHAVDPRFSPLLTATEAQIYVRDFAAACDFYCTKLGFSLAFSYGSPPHYGMVAREGARLCLRLVHEDVFAGDIREREQLLSAAFVVADAAGIRGLFEAFKAAGVAFHAPLQAQPWGALNFIVRDLDGNLILFAAPAD